MATKKFKIRYHGIDGNSTDSFSSLAKAGKFLAERYQGPEYLRGSHSMGTDYAQYELVGFSLSDVGKFDYSEGYIEFEFYDWAGGRLVEVKRFAVVAWSEEEDRLPQKTVIASFGTREQAIAEAIRLCNDATTIHVEDNGKNIGWAHDKDFYDDVPFEQVAFRDESPAPF